MAAAIVSGEAVNVGFIVAFMASERRRHDDFWSTPAQMQSRAARLAQLTPPLMLAAIKLALFHLALAPLGARLSRRTEVIVVVIVFRLALRAKSVGEWWFRYDTAEKTVECIVLTLPRAAIDLQQRQSAGQTVTGDKKTRVQRG